MRMRERRRVAGEEVRRREREYWAAHPERKRAKDARLRAKYTEADRERQRENWRRWRERNPDDAREMARRNTANHSARKRDAFVEDVRPGVVYERGNGTCGICGEPVKREQFDVDHIVPLSRGGEHSYANTQPAHRTCNLRKAARLDYQHSVAA